MQAFEYNYNNVIKHTHTAFTVQKEKLFWYIN